MYIYLNYYYYLVKLFAFALSCFSQETMRPVSSVRMKTLRPINQQENKV